MSLAKQYFEDTILYKSKYGEKTIVLIQVGAFYEVYGLKHNNTIMGSNIEEFSQKCDLIIAEKSNYIDKKMVVMSGFRDYSLDKYLQKLDNLQYTTIVISQDEQCCGTTRSITGIYSPGTYFSNNSTEITNNIMSIWIFTNKHNIIFGIANVDIYTGKSVVYEYATGCNKYTMVLDELERFISIYNPKQTLLIFDNRPIDYSRILQLFSRCVQELHVDTDHPDRDKLNNCKKQIYQKTILKKFYGETIFDFREWSIATQSLCYLLEFIGEHNPNLVHKISPPEIENSFSTMLLGNHSLKQLNIVNTTEKDSKISSVANFLNMCVTSMGKRKLYATLVRPSCNHDDLNREYDIGEHLYDNELVITSRQELRKVVDIEKLTRKLVLKTTTPYDIYMIHESLQHIILLYNTIQSDNHLEKYLSCDNITLYCREIMNIIHNTLNLEQSKLINKLEFIDNFINPGIDNSLDNIVNKLSTSRIILDELRDYFHNKLAIYEKNSRTREYIHIKFTEKQGYTLQTTKRRLEILKQVIDKTITIQDTTFDLTQLDCNKSAGSNYSFTTPSIKNICNNLVSLKDELSDKLSIIYKQFLNTLLNTSIDKLDNIIKFVADLDFVTTKSHIASKYNYSRPIIKPNSSSNLSIKNLRHVLIERILEDELYVENDIILNNDQTGILLYGTNAVGKSSFIKSIGIAVILAQAGFFVPCTEMIYTPYDHIFTRILGNDDLFKGLSTFAVEMLEFKNILNQATSNSLILGDELCSGTETNSAISIFVTGIDYLYKRNSNFIFATHFHEIVDYDEIKTKERLSLKHMTVVYNHEKDELIYDRKLKDGSGNSMYGLEVCKGLHLPEQFLIDAHRLRNQYNKMSNLILKQEGSHFNTKKIKGLCEMCNLKPCTEVHHLLHQSNADDKGYIGQYNKNALANLMNLCEECHLKIHKTGKQHQRKKTTKGTILQEI